jgi:predicted transcriptional regulator
MSQPTPTDREMEILKILWDIGPATVREVYEIMRRHESLAQGTVQTFLRIMTAKGFVTFETRGRSFVYRASYSRKRCVSAFLNQVFDGAVGALVADALSVKSPNDREIEELEALVRELRQGRDGRAKRRS